MVTYFFLSRNFEVTYLQIARKNVLVEPHFIQKSTICTENQFIGPCVRKSLLKGFSEQFFLQIFKSTGRLLQNLLRTATVFYSREQITVLYLLQIAVLSHKTNIWLFLIFFVNKPFVQRCIVPTRYKQLIIRLTDSQPIFNKVKDEKRN